MILRADRIREMLAAGQKAEADDPLIIVPTPNDEALEEAQASVDLRLGTWFVATKPAQIAFLKLGQTQSETELTSTVYVPFGSSYILHPQSFVLAVTMEWIALPRDIAAYVNGKSSWGRYGLIIATAIGVHPGYKGCLTLELTNVGEVPIEIMPGSRICQLFLHKVEVSESARVDTSDLGGMRRPTLRPIALDSLARQLSMAYRERGK